MKIISFFAALIKRGNNKPYRSMFAKVKSKPKPPIISQGMTDIVLHLAPHEKILPNDKFEVCIYAGNIQSHILKYPYPTGRLLFKGTAGETSIIKETGRACFFILLQNGKAVEVGKIGVTACPFTTTNTQLIKSNAITIRLVK